MNFVILGSSSSGNSSLFFDDEKLILLDCGHSYKYIREKLHELSLSDRKIDYIILTHEHVDHVRSLKTFILRENPVIFSTKGTVDGAVRGLKIEDGNFNIFKPGDMFEIGKVKVESFIIPHDTPEPCGFKFKINGKTLSYALDLGYLTELVKYKLEGANYLVLESNYDEELLTEGPYPLSTKYRIKNRLGHLSNNDVASFFKNEFDGKCEKIFLGHISRTNNTHSIVYKNALSVLKTRFKKDFSLECILPKKISQIITF